MSNAPYETPEEERRRHECERLDTEAMQVERRLKEVAEQFADTEQLTFFHTTEVEEEEGEEPQLAGYLELQISVKGDMAREVLHEMALALIGVQDVIRCAANSQEREDDWIEEQRRLRRSQLLRRF